MQNFRALGAPPPDPRASGGWGLCPQTPSLRRLGASPPDPHWPPAAGGSAPRPPKQPPPIAIFWLRACFCITSFSLRSELDRTRISVLFLRIQFYRKMWIRIRIWHCPLLQIFWARNQHFWSASEFGPRNRSNFE